MADRIKVFFCERTGERRYDQTYRCTCGHRTTQPCTAEEYEESDWPEMTCEQCGASGRTTSRGCETQWRRLDTGELFFKLPPGAVYEHHSTVEEAHNWRQSKREDGKEYYVTRLNEQDGRVLACVCPDGHHWVIDGRASNCTMKDDDGHWCWVRHGRPEDGTLHVDKNGYTCAAGAGSILTHTGWHGFLHNGELYGC